MDCICYVIMQGGRQKMYLNTKITNLLNKARTVIGRHRIEPSVYFSDEYFAIHTLC